VPCVCLCVCVVAQQICVSLNVPSDHYRVGTNKLFMRKEIYDKLEEERSLPQHYA
jgi:myosin heavy subunit